MDERGNMAVKRYVVADGGKHVEPRYDRMVVALTDEALAEELAAGRGEPGYQQALQAERERRAAR